jgi:gamma-tubulin complex component 4
MQRMRLEYAVAPPIDLVLLPDDFERYNALFKFLFLVKRCQLQLQKLWPWQMRTIKSTQKSLIPKAEVPIEAARMRCVFLLRAKMQFFIDNLQYYLQVDVLQASFDEMVKRIGT